MSAGTMTEADIALRTTPNGETTLYINGAQAMQAWEEPLMQHCARLLCEQGGSEFLECGLGLGLSARAIAAHPNTRRHVVVEKYQRVIDLFTERAGDLGPLEIVCDDFFEYVERLPDESVDGILFDPYLSKELWEDLEWRRSALEGCRRVLRTGGAFVPYFSTSPKFKEEYAQTFPRMVMETARYEAYPTTAYTFGLSGWAYVQCYFKV